MIIDFNQYADIGLKYDVCIVGSGAAGTVLFDILSRTKLKIILLESGSEPLDSESQELNEGFLRLNGKQSSDEDSRVKSALPHRTRGLGGSTNCWMGQCWPFPAETFSQRSWVKDSGWPVDLTQLKPFYDVASQYVEITSDIFDERLWSLIGVPLPYDFSTTEIKTVFGIRSGFLVNNEHAYLNWPGPVRFKKFLVTRDVEKSSNVVLYGATLTDLRSNADGIVKYGEIVNAKLQKRRIEANIFILAAGGFENPRILLNANGGTGIGNETDCVGRYYNGHPVGMPADLICPNKTVATELQWKFQYQKVGNNRAIPHFAFRESAQQRHQLLNSGIWLVADVDKESAVYKVMTLRDQLMSGGITALDISFSEALVLLANLDDLLVNAIRKLRNQGVKARMMEKIPLSYIAEGTPKRSSRIYLSKEKDRFGVKKLICDWHFDDQEIENMYKVFKLFSKTARDLGWGRIQFRPESDVNSSDPFRGLHDAAHPSGTTRMSNDIKRGVVDKNLRVHSVKNLYVCGSSVFPTNGYESPTFTIVALAARLAEHLKNIKI